MELMPQADERVTMMIIENRPFTTGELEIISAANKEIEALRSLVRAVLAALSQKKTHQADIDYAKSLCRQVLEE